jgi:membrane protease YdiL (CAAX protease family)
VIDPFRTADGRLRSLWRLCLAAVFFVAVSFATSVAFAAAVSVPSAAVPGELSTIVVPQSVLGVALSVAVVVAARYLDRRTRSDLGLSTDRRWRLDLLAGLGFGFGLVAVPYLLGVALGVYEPTLSPAAPAGYTVAEAFALLAAFAVVVGVYEELIFRGYLLRNLAEGLTIAVSPSRAVLGSVALSSLAFGAVHGLNPNMTPLGIATIVVAGVLLAVGYVLTERLALPIGFHISWNFAHFVFGLPVSGLDVDVRLVATERVGAAIVHGGSVGLEGGVLGFGAAVAGCLAVVGYALWMGDAFDAGAAEPELRSNQP